MVYRVTDWTELVSGKPGALLELVGGRSYLPHLRDRYSDHGRGYLPLLPLTCSTALAVLNGFSLALIVRSRNTMCAFRLSHTNQVVRSDSLLITLYHSIALNSGGSSVVGLPPT